jgi:mycothiol synthase
MVLFRAPRLDEAGAVTDLLNACSVAEIGVPDTLEDQVRSSWERPGRDLDADVIVAEDGDRLVAYVEVDARPPWTGLRIDGYVHPAAMGRGIGSAILERGEARARALAARAAQGERVALFHGVWHGAPGARLLEGRGYALSRLFWRMRIELDSPPRDAEWPDGISVRPAAPGEDRALHAADEEAFADHWQHRASPFDVWQHEQVSHPGYDRSLWFVAVDGEEIAGGVMCRRFDSEDPDAAYVADVFVRRPWRRRGMARALLLHAFGELYRRGICAAALDVDSQNPTGATGVYERVGMHVQRRVDIYEKELVAAGNEPVTPRG